jgi:anti-sigma regulatory factor (Ser/Thr protein kinase)
MMRLAEVETSGEPRQAPVSLHIGPAWHRGTRVSWVLLPDPATVPKTRRRVRRELAAWGVGEHGDVVELLVSEVVTNAMRHSWGAVMTISIEGATLRCEVQDTNPALPQVCCAHEGDEGGRGMYLMEALSDSWGSYRVPAGKVVWFETTCPAEALAAAAG